MIPRDSVNHFLQNQRDPERIESSVAFARKTRRLKRQRRAGSNPPPEESQAGPADVLIARRIPVGPAPASLAARNPSRHPASRARPGLFRTASRIFPAICKSSVSRPFDLAETGARSRGQCRRGARLFRLPGAQSISAAARLHPSPPSAVAGGSRPPARDSEEYSPPAALILLYDNYGEY